MAIYLGSKKKKLNINGVKHIVNIYSQELVNNTVRLLSSDNHILKDSNGVYLVPKGSE